MKKYLINLLGYGLLSFFIVLLFHIQSYDYFIIKYGMPKNIVHLLFMILFCALNGLLYFNMFEYFIYLKNFVIYRIGNKGYFKQLSIRMFLHCFIFIIFNIMVDYLLVQEISYLVVINVIYFFIDYVLLHIYLRMYNHFDNSYIIFVVLFIVIRGIGGMLL